jgi:hypothetical protein
MACIAQTHIERLGRVEREGLRLYGLEAALIEASPRYFVTQPTPAPRWL